MQLEAITRAFHSHLPNRPILTRLSPYALGTTALSRRKISYSLYAWFFIVFYIHRAVATLVLASSVQLRVHVDHIISYHITLTLLRTCMRIACCWLRAGVIVHVCKLGWCFVAAVTILTVRHPRGEADIRNPVCFNFARTRGQYELSFFLIARHIVFPQFVYWPKSTKVDTYSRQMLLILVIKTNWKSKKNGRKNNDECDTMN